MEINLNQSQLQELSIEEMIHIDGGIVEGGFWHGFFAGLITTLLIIALL